MRKTKQAAHTARAAFCFPPENNQKPRYPLGDNQGLRPCMLVLRTSMLLKSKILTAKRLIVTDAPNSREYCGVRAYSKFY